jgi:phage shock protein PspC (stress-responsive transcriptional regulator)
MGDIIHRSRMHVDLEPERVRRAVIEGFEDQPVVYGVRGGVAEHYGVEPEVERPLTLDHVATALAA